MQKTTSRFPAVSKASGVVLSDLTWDQWFLLKCRTVALKSKDPHTKVGAVIADGTRQLSEGYNGFPSGMNNLGFMWERPEKYNWVVHAEENAVAWAARRGIAVEGGTLYCSLHPCAKCARLIAAAGIVEVVYDYDLEDAYTNRDFHAMDLAKSIFHKTGITIRSASCQ